MQQHNYLLTRNILRNVFRAMNTKLYSTDCITLFVQNILLYKRIQTIKYLRFLNCMKIFMYSF